MYITVRLSNPDNYEILSFTLNGKKYSSYMFEEGSDMENLVLKVDKNSLGGGINEYTIDAIKYVDGTDIKDVRMDGDRTVKIGVRVGDDMTRAVIANEQIGLTSVQFDVSVVDDYSLIARSEGYVKAALYDGLKMIYKDISLDGTTTHVEFGNLLPNTLYQYAVVALYDNLSGDGVQLNTLHKRSFYTDTIVLFADVELTQTGVSWSYTWHESAKNKQITALRLTKDGSKVRDLPADATSVNGLLSGNEYTLTATYKNIYGTNENISIAFTTLAKTAPTVEISNITSTKNTIEADLSYTDPDKISTIAEVALYNGDDKITTTDWRDHVIFSELNDDTDYTIKVTLVYDLNDGKGQQTLTSECTVHTLPTFRYVVNDTSVEIIGVVYNDGDSIVFPDYIKGLPVKKIGSVFNNARLRRVVLPDTLEELGTQAFYNTNVDEEIVIPRNVQTIGEDAFCNFVGELTFDPYCRIEVISQNAFFYAKLSNVLVLPSTVKTLEDRAFYWMATPGLVLNEGLTYIGVDAIDILGGVSVYLPSTVKSCTAPGNKVVVSSANKYLTDYDFASSHKVRLHDGDNVSVVEGEYVVLPAPEKAGYRFAGWKTVDGEYVQSVYIPSEDVDLYAVWVERNNADGMAATTPLRLSDGVSVRVTVKTLDKIYFAIDAEKAGNYVVTVKIALPGRQGNGDNAKCNFCLAGSYDTFATSGQTFVYAPSDVLYFTPFLSGVSWMRTPFEVVITVLAM